ncbi:MAG: hypothetical protein ACHQFZ_01065 [Acidimicrobiales bacterium]
MSAHTQLHFSHERAAPVQAVESIAAGRGWCNVVPDVVDDVADLKVNYFGLWVNRGASVASFVTSPPRAGVAQPSTLGVLHSRGRLGRELIAALVGDPALPLEQDHSQRGLILGVPPATPASHVLDLMCSLSAALCDFDMTGTWRLDLYVRDIA